MTKERMVLEDEAYAAPMHRNEDPTRVVLPALAEHVDLASTPVQAGDHPKARGLACAGGSEQRGDPGPRDVEVDVDRERSAAAPEAEADARRAPRRADAKVFVR